MLQRLPIVLAQISASNNPEHLLNEIKQIFYSLYQSTEIYIYIYYVIEYYVIKHLILLIIQNMMDITEALLHLKVVTWILKKMKNWLKNFKNQLIKVFEKEKYIHYLKTIFRVLILQICNQ